MRKIIIMKIDNGYDLNEEELDFATKLYQDTKA